MSFMKAGRRLQVPLLLASVFALAACGFHLRANVKLPASMQKVHLTVAGGGDFQRMLARKLEVSGIDVQESGGSGIAELNVPVAHFSTETITGGGYVQISEYAVHYSVRFSVTDANGEVVVANQPIEMTREYSYDSTDTIGNASQVQELQQSLNDDMVQAILFRLQAATNHKPTNPAAAPDGTH